MSETRKKHFWIISELFYPDETSTAYILTCIARRLSSEYDVHVICGRSRCSMARTPDFKVSVHACGKSTISGRNLAMRAIRMIILTCRLVFAGFRFIRKHEPILIVTNPAPLMVGITLLKKLKKSRMTLLVHDVFPENALAAGIFSSDNGFVYRLLQSVFNHAYRAADQLIVGA